jgi:hypothetical protein
MRYPHHLISPNLATSPSSHNNTSHKIPISSTTSNHTTSHHDTAVKYSQYELAITKALSLRPKNIPTVITVVGPGRGPLIQASLNAAEATGRYFLTTLLYSPQYAQQRIYHHHTTTNTSDTPQRTSLTTITPQHTRSHHNTITEQQTSPYTASKRT